MYLSCKSHRWNIFVNIWWVNDRRTQTCACFFLATSLSCILCDPYNAHFVTNIADLDKKVLVITFKQRRNSSVRLFICEIYETCQETIIKLQYVNIYMHILYICEAAVINILMLLLTFFSVVKLFLCTIKEMPFW